MKACLILEVETLDHELIALFRQQTINYFNGKALQLKGGEVTPLIRQSYTRTTELIADVVIKKLIDGTFSSVKLIDSRWDSVDVVSKEEEATILAPPG